MTETFRRIEEHLRPWARGTAITPDTEVYRDLGIYGDDLAFDVVLWATGEFGVEGRLNVAKYAPGERPFHGLRKWLRRLFGIKSRQFQSFKVRDVIAAIEVKRWPD
jgi:hypothetical protein